MKIFYIGSSLPSSTSCHRAEALRRLGHDVLMADPYQALFFLLSGKILGKINYVTGYSFIQIFVSIWIFSKFKNINTCDLIWMDNGELFGGFALRQLKKYRKKIILFNHDDPTGGRDGRRFYSLLKALPYYDICAVVRIVNIKEYAAYGAKNILKIWMSYDEARHFPLISFDDLDEKYKADIVFIGTWMRNEHRDEFILKLIRSGLSVRIWGGRWNKSPYWNELSKYVAGGALSGRDYVAAISGAKICLGLLSSGNRDLHTTRSMEIPYAGGLFCAQRTTEHEHLYVDNVECVLWDDVNDCIRKCTELLADDIGREKIRLAGMERVRLNKVGHEDQCKIILDKVMAL